MSTNIDQVKLGWMDFSPMAKVVCPRVRRIWPQSATAWQSSTDIAPALTNTGRSRDPLRSGKIVTPERCWSNVAQPRGGWLGNPSAACGSQASGGRSVGLYLTKRKPAGIHEASRDLWSPPRGVRDLSTLFGAARGPLGRRLRASRGPAGGPATPPGGLPEAFPDPPLRVLHYTLGGLLSALPEYPRDS